MRQSVLPNPRRTAFRKLLGIREPTPPEEAIAGLPSIVVTYELDLPASGLARGATTAG